MQPQDIAVHIGSMKERFDELEKQLAAPDIYSRPAECKALSRERQYLAGIFESYEAWNRVLEEIRGNRELLTQEKDPEFLALLESDLEELEKRSAQIEQRLTIALIPRDAADSRDTIVEIRPAAGGEEAALFAGEMFRMYLKFAEKKGWRSEVLEQSDSDLGGIREAVFSLSGNDVFSLMKFESGVHRVQRVPVTESGGRIHTSTITVSVLPEAEETDEIEIRHEDLEISTFRSSGPGGQNVNKVESGVRLRYIWKNPNTGVAEEILIECTETRDQPKNKERALARLRTFIYDKEHQKYIDDIASKRKTMVSTGDRSAKIRTYNYPQGRITDHRINYTIYNLTAFMDGDIQDCIDHLIVAENAERLKESEL